MPTIYKDGYEYGAGGGTVDLTEVNGAIETIYNLLTDSESGTAALKVLIDSTLQNETAIKNIVNSADYGNAQIKSVIDTINTNTAASQTAIANTTYGLNALQALLTNGTYGLNALKTAIGNISGGGGGGGSYSTSAIYTATTTDTWTSSNKQVVAGSYIPPGGIYGPNGVTTPTKTYYDWTRTHTPIKISGKGKCYLYSWSTSDKAQSFNVFKIYIDGIDVTSIANYEHCHNYSSISYEANYSNWAGHTSSSSNGPGTPTPPAFPGGLEFTKSLVVQPATVEVKYKETEPYYPTGNGTIKMLVFR